MLIRDNKMKMKSLDAIANAKDCSYYRMLPTGHLLINHYFKSYVFLAYVRGNWFASYGNRKGSSMAVPENGLDLFASSNDSIWIQNEDGDIDVSTSLLPLDKSTCALLFAFSGKSYDVIIADGSKYHTVITTSIKKTDDNTAFLIMALTALIRQYDSKAADDILNFWFQKKLSDEPEKSTPRTTIDWQKNDEKAESQ